jgi:L-seryl-tRNA(Ser) seleniumtransferase
MSHGQQRNIPAVEKILQAIGETELPRPALVALVRRELALLRGEKTVADFDAIVVRIRGSVKAMNASRIRPLINGTGVLIHTNLGRAPLGSSVIEAISQVGSNYSNLEYDLRQGSRGGRALFLEQNLALLCGSEASTVVNNNAAALVLILRHFCESAAPEHSRQHGGARQKQEPVNEVVISRGELIQIGGGFRIPEILETSGARLVEIGTTNKTTLSDYSRAITRRTAMILKVHRSNFYMEGFVDSPPPEKIAALAGGRRVPFVEDLGSGVIIETHRISGAEHEPTPMEAIRRGVDLVCFSGDKMFGGPQAGIIAGKKKWIAGLKKEPLFRALRSDKLVLAALEKLVDSYLRFAGSAASKATAADGMISAHSIGLNCDVPILRLLGTPLDELRARAEKLVAALNQPALKASVGQGFSRIGGGTLPRSSIASVTIDLRHEHLKPGEIAAHLRNRAMPVIGYVDRGNFKLDLRTVFPRQDAELLSAIRELSTFDGMK